MRKTSPGCNWPDFPSACSTAFQSASDACWAVARGGAGLRTAIAAIAIAAMPTVTSTYLRLGLRIAWILRLSRVLMVKVAHGGPPDVVHECIDAFCRRRAVIHVVRVLVHIEREDRAATRETVGVIGGPLIDQFAIAMRVRQQHPAGPAAHRL